MQIQKIIDSIETALDLGDLKTACKIFSSIDDDEVFEIVAKSYPGLMNYDSNGGWVGRVSHENGWTP